jgi:hypothetical protein
MSRVRGLVVSGRRFFVHLDPVNAGLVSRVDAWPWSSEHDHAGGVIQRSVPPSGLSVDRILAAAGHGTRI